MRFKFSYILMLVLPLALISPIETGYQIDSNSILLPSEEWHLIKTDANEYSSKIINNASSSKTNSVDYSFDRGDISDIIIKHNRNTVSKGDSILFINSILLDQNINNLEQELLVEKSKFKSVSTGKKIQIIQGFKRKLKLAKNILKLKENNYKRALPLVKKELMSEIEFDKVKNELENARINLEIAEKNLEDVSTGDKLEDVELAKSRIAMLQSKLNQLKFRKDKQIITSPFDGKISFYSDSNKVVTIKNTEKLIVKIPIKLSDLQYVKTGSLVNISLKSKDTVVSSKISNISEEIFTKGRNQFVLATTEINNEKREFQPGMICKSSIQTDNVTLLEFVKRKLKF